MNAKRRIHSASVVRALCAYAEKLRASGRARQAKRTVAPFFIVRVHLVGVAPRIWRILYVHSDLSLQHFHGQVLAPAFGFKRNYHSFAFCRAPGEPWLGSPRSTALDAHHRALFVGAVGQASRVRVGDLLKRVCSKCCWVHDLGDWWQHTIELMGISESPPIALRSLAASAEVAGVVQGANAGVPADIGGPSEFASPLVGFTCMHHPVLQFPKRVSLFHINWLHPLVLFRNCRTNCFQTPR